MTLPVLPFGDVEAALTGYLRGVLDPGVHVGTEWPGNLLDRLPAVSLSRSGGGTALRGVLDSPVVDTDILAADKAAAHDLAQLVAAHYAAAEGTTQGGLQIHLVDNVSLVWLPWEPDEGADPIPRYVLVTDLRTRTVPA